MGAFVLRGGRIGKGSKGRNLGDLRVLSAIWPGCSSLEVILGGG